MTASVKIVHWAVFVGPSLPMTLRQLGSDSLLSLEGGEETMDEDRGEEGG